MKTNEQIIEEIEKRMVHLKDTMATLPRGNVYYNFLDGEELALRKLLSWITQKNNIDEVKNEMDM
jgi:hypothetical protein